MCYTSVVWQHYIPLLTVRSGDPIPVLASLFRTPSSPALEPTQPPIKWVPGHSQR